MDDDQLDDLKQFIEARLSQTEQSIKADSKMEMEQLKAEMHGGFDGVGEAIEQANQHTDERYQELNARMAKLEQQAAA